MPNYYREPGKPGSRFPSIVRPGEYVSRREHQKEIGRPLPSPLKVPAPFIEIFRDTHPDRKDLRRMPGAHKAWLESHATLYAQNHGESHPTKGDLRRVRRDPAFKQALADLFSNDREAQMRGGEAIYGSPNPQDWRYAIGRLAA